MIRVAVRIVVSSCLVASGAFAAAPTILEWATSCVQIRLLAPLAAKEAKRSAFSRAAPAPSERRVRIQDPQFVLDGKGQKFVLYEVEASYGEDWQTAFTGCVYQGSGKVFVAQGDQFYPSEFMLGKDVEAVSGACTVPK